MATTISEESQKAGQRAANPYKEGSRAHQMYENNPYTQETFTRKHTWWDTFVEDMGLRSGYESAQDEWLAAGKDYDAQIAEIDAADKYNSETAKAARMKEAGLNPDLTGLQGASEAEEFANKEAAPNPNVNEPTFKVANLIDGLGKAFVSVMGMGKDLAGTIGILQDIEGKKLENAGKLDKLVQSFVENFTPDTTRNDEGKAEYDWNSTKSRITQMAEVWAKNNNLNKKQTGQFIASLGGYMESNKGTIFEKWKKNLHGKNEFGKIMTSKYKSTEDSVEEVTRIWAGLEDDLNKTFEYTIKGEGAEKKYKTEYYNNLDGATIAAGENAEGKAKKEKADMQAEVRGAINKASEALEKAANEGNWFALILKSLLPGFYLKYVE